MTLFNLSYVLQLHDNDVCWLTLDPILSTVLPYSFKGPGVADQSNHGGTHSGELWTLECRSGWCRCISLPVLISTGDSLPPTLFTEGELNALEVEARQLVLFPALDSSSLARMSR